MPPGAGRQDRIGRLRPAIGAAAGLLIVSLSAASGRITELHRAAREGDALRAAAILAKSPGCRDGLDDFGFTALHWAALSGKEKILGLLLEAGADMESRGGRCASRPLHLAASRGAAAVIERLVFRRADVNARDRWGRTPLHAAAAAGRVIPIRLLAGAGGRIEARDAVGLTPLHAACEGGWEEAIVALMELGASPNATDESGQTPVHIAAWEGSIRVLRMLIDKGGNPNLADLEGLTPLHRAARCGRFEAVRFLLSRGADNSARDITGRTAHEYARLFGFGEVATLLGAKKDEPF